MQNQINPYLISAFVGWFLGFITNFASTVMNYYSSKSRAREDRDETFKLKIIEMRIVAAQKAYQYLFKVYRACEINSKDPLTVKLSNEARDWLDGQALILGDDIYQAVFYSFNSLTLQVSKRYEIFEDAKKKLKSILKKPYLS